MKIAFDNSFKKDSSKIPKPILIKAKSLIQEITISNDFQSHNKIKKLKGHTEHFRFIIGDYRLGCYLVVP
jgi:mRNA-degrading endonuclease RelE of RelBE toxin-antitoxin system